MLVLAAGYWLSRPSPAPPATGEAKPPAESLATATAHPGPTSEETELKPLSPSELRRASRKQPMAPATTRILTPAVSVAQRAPAAPHVTQLIATLTNIDFSHGPITSAQAEQWKQTLQSLVAQGAAALPAIRDFMDLNQDFDFNALAGGELLGQSSVRTALINALQQIGGPEAASQMAQLLQTTTVPAEIELIAGHLEQMAPGQYRKDALNAANDVLALAVKGQLPGWDVGSLFKVIQNYGDAFQANSLEKLQGQYKYYAAVSLANLPDGAGVPGLIRQTRNPSESHDFSYQMLAQAASQYQAAGDALIEQARLNQIPDSAWRKIASELSGEQYQVGQPPPGTPLADVKQYHIEAGNQNFYSVNARGAQNAALIDRLLATTSNPAAISALQTARAAVGK